MIEQKMKLREGINIKVIRKGKVIVNKDIDREKEKNILTGEIRRKE
jgi:hypothetical protein